MDLEQTVAELQSKNEQLGQENERLNLLLSVFKENIEMRTLIQRSSNESLEAPTVCFPSERKEFSLWKTTLNEREFSKDLDQTKIQHEHRTSSPTHSKPVKQRSAQTDPCEEAKPTSCPADVAEDMILGEIALQLDRRILSRVFQGHKRLYGFTLHNVPAKILEVSTQLMTGKVDKGYQNYLTQRYVDLMEQLNKLGYKTSVHPQFSEFIINTYGILKEKSGDSSIRTGTYQANYNNPETLKTLIMTIAPVKLQENLLLLLKCLCKMAEKDRKPILLF